MLSLAPILMLTLCGCQALPQRDVWITSPMAAATLLAPSPTVIRPITPDMPDPSGSTQGCYYAWATRELPELGAELQALLGQTDSALQVSAYAFGEECRAVWGEPTFLAMETDFRVRVSVASLTNEEAMGDAIRAAMAAIESLPPNQLHGTRPGRVEFEFAAADGDSLRLNIEIAHFRRVAPGLDGSALFSLFQGMP